MQVGSPETAAALALVDHLRIDHHLKPLPFKGATGRATQHNLQAICPDRSVPPNVLQGRVTDGNLGPKESSNGGDT